MPPLPLNGISDVCNAVDALIRAVVGPQVDVREVRHSSLLWAVSLRGDGIVWSYDGYEKVGGGPLGDRGKQDYVFRFTIAPIGMDWSSAEGANKKAREMAEQLRGAPSESTLALTDRAPNLRIGSPPNTPLGTIGPDSLWLEFMSETTQLLGATPAFGGREAFVQKWQTTTLMRV